MKCYPVLCKLCYRVTVRKLDDMVCLKSGAAYSIYRPGWLPSKTNPNPIQLVAWPDFTPSHCCRPTTMSILWCRFFVMAQLTKCRWFIRLPEVEFHHRLYPFPVLVPPSWIEASDIPQCRRTNGWRACAVFTVRAQRKISFWVRSHRYRKWRQAVRASG